MRIRDEYIYMGAKKNFKRQDFCNIHHANIFKTDFVKNICNL